MNLHVEVRGTGPALLMCNGIGSSIDMWGRFADRLSEHHTLILFDAPGCGRSSTPWRPYSMPELASRVVAQVLSHGFTSVDVLGFSFGGTLGQQIAAQFPGIVNKLVLLSTLSGIPGLIGPAHVTSLASSPARFAAATFAEIIAPVLARDPAILAGTRPTMRGLMLQALAIGTWLGVTGIDVPTLVVGGSDDVITPVGNVHAIAARIPGSCAIEIDNAGHLWMLHHADDAATYVLDHLADHHVQEIAA